MTNTSTRSYSGLFIVIPEKNDAFDEMKDLINSVITENSGKIEKENVMGKRTLAYPIKKKAEGIYYEVSFSAPPEGVAGMMKQFRINTDILRTLIDKSA
jgi:small subunit ribosomal protein S6